jgi:hypothetical protein
MDKEAGEENELITGIEMLTQHQQPDDEDNIGRARYF